MGKSADPLAVALGPGSGACSCSRLKPVDQEVPVVHQQRSATPASARSAASSGSQTRSVSQSPSASTPKRLRIASRIQLDLLHPVHAAGSDASTGS